MKNKPIDLMKLSKRGEYALRALINMSTAPSTIPASEPEWLALVREKVEGLRFGVVQIVVHDRKVTQIERTEKTRLDPAPVEPSPRQETR
jgi:hypothetical protein